MLHVDCRLCRGGAGARASGAKATDAVCVAETGRRGIRLLRQAMSEGADRNLGKHGLTYHNKFSSPGHSPDLSVTSSGSAPRDGPSGWQKKT